MTDDTLRAAVLAEHDRLRDEHGESHDCDECLTVQRLTDAALAASAPDERPRDVSDPDPNAVEVSPGVWRHWGLYLRGAASAPDEGPRQPPLTGDVHIAYRIITDPADSDIVPPGWTTIGYGRAALAASAPDEGRGSRAYRPNGRAAAASAPDEGPRHSDTAQLDWRDTR